VRMKHLFQKHPPHGVYYFRRRVPSDLVKVVGRARIKKSLKTSNLVQAKARAEKLAAEYESEWVKLREGGGVVDSFKSVEKLLESYGVDSFGSDGDIGKWSFYDSLLEKQDHSLLVRYNGGYSALDDPDAKLSNLERKGLNRLSGQVLTLADTIEYYLEAKDKLGDKKFAGEARRALRFFVAVLGDRPLDTYRRKEIAKRLRDGVNEMKTGSVRKQLMYVCTAVNRVIRDYEYAFNNPFNNQDIPDLGADEQSRSSLNKEQQSSLIQLLDNAEVGDTINTLKILFDTGMRVAEVVGLKTEDIYLEHEIPHIKLQRNPFRPLKTKQSQRLIPLMGYALEGVKSQLTDSEWLFPRYIDEDKGRIKNDGASAAFNKRIKPLGFTCHYLRHNFKDRLRLANVPMENVKDLQGWSRGDQASRYGETSLLKLLYNDMKKANVWRDPCDF
jgi:integrase